MLPRSDVVLPKELVSQRDVAGRRLEILDLLRHRKVESVLRGRACISDRLHVPSRVFDPSGRRKSATTAQHRPTWCQRCHYRTVSGSAKAGEILYHLAGSAAGGSFTSLPRRDRLLRPALFGWAMMAQPILGPSGATSHSEEYFALWPKCDC